MPRSDIARVDECVLGSISESPVVSAHMSCPMFRVILQESAVSLARDSGVRFPVDRRPNET
jgi:hypothetical protein